MDAAHQLVLLAGVSDLPSIFAGLFSARFGTPILLMFLAIGMLFGKERPVSLVLNCTQIAYLIGSEALAVNPVRGGLKTKRSMLKIACGLRLRWPGLESRFHAAILFYEESGGVAPLLRWLSSAAHNDFAALWFAYMLLCRRFADVLADACARLGADVGRYSFISVEFHHILLAVSRRTHLRYGPLACSTARGRLCHDASIPPVTQQNRSSATRAIDNSLHGTFLHW